MHYTQRVFFFTQFALLIRNACYTWKTVSRTGSDKLLDFTAKAGCFKMPELSRRHITIRFSIKPLSTGMPRLFFFFFFLP